MSLINLILNILSDILNPTKGYNMEYVTKNFTENELKCSQSGVIQFHKGFLNALQELRDAYDKPMQINSGCRSKAFQSTLNPKASNSYHVYDITHGGRTGALAVDVSMRDSHNRAELIHLALEMGWSIGVYKNFLHLDRRVDLGHGRLVFRGDY